MRILLLEDDALLGEALRDFMHLDGHVVEWCRRLGQARAAFAHTPYDALVIDWQLPDGSGLDWLVGLRQAHDPTPAIIITAKDRLPDRLAGLDSGADDYLVKPFEPEELVARVRAVRRRSAGSPTPVLTFGDVTLDLSARTAKRHQTTVALTAKEWLLVEALALRQGRTVSKTDLEDLVAGFDGSLSANALEVHISAIRRKLGKDLIQTHRGLGYRMEH